MADEGGKKRKRAADASPEEPPTKKAAIDTPLSGTIKVSFVDDIPNLKPVIASTPGVVFPTDIPLTPYVKDSSRTSNKHTLPPGHRRTSLRNTSELLLHSSAHPKVDYTAVEEIGGTTESPLKHYAGIYDPATSQLQVVELTKMVLRSSLRPTQKELDRAAKSKKKLSVAAQRAALGLAFGTAKAKKLIEAAQTNSVQLDDYLKDKSLDDIGMIRDGDTHPSQEEQQAAVENAKPRPRANPDANTPAEVYPVPALVAPDLLRQVRVDDWVAAAEAGTDVRTSSRFVARRLDALVREGDSERLQLLRYMLALLQFLGAGRTNRDGGRKLPPREKLVEKVAATGGGGPNGVGISEAVVEGIRRKFAAGGEMTRWHVDYLITHLCALSLIMDGYETDMSDLRDDLRLENKQTSQYFQELGCHVRALSATERERLKFGKAEAATHRVAQLRLPLEFPKRKLKTRRRR